ncbi:MAG: hypothetical protein ABF791_05670 [Acetobacter sp.]|uniref:hypothetical protein n=1 Tax=Acetobacter sp. TaxID=440 RepID=UPI0039E89A3C
MTILPPVRLPTPSGGTEPYALSASVLGRVALVMQNLLDDPAAMPSQILKRHSLPMSLHSFDLNMLWLWADPVVQFLKTVTGFDRLRLTATNGKGTTYMATLNDLARTPLCSALETLRTAFGHPPGPASIEQVGRIVLHDLRPSCRGIEDDLAAFQKEPLPCRLDLWLEELGWPDLVKTAEAHDRAVKGLIYNLPGMTIGAIQREMRRIAA